MWSVVLMAAAMVPGAGAPRCEATEVAGIPAADAATAVAIVCGELHRVSGGAGAFGVSVRSLGQSVVLTVKRDGAEEGKTLVLDGLREVPVAATRLAEAVVLGKPIEGTRLVDNLVESEGRQLVTRSGSGKLELGATGLAAGQSTGAGAGFTIGFAYDSPAFAIPAALSFSHSSSGDRSLSVFSIDTGGRYYFSRHDASPFVGGGLSMLHLSLSDLRRGAGFEYTSVEDSHWGPGLYLETGVQLARLHRGRLTARVRADVPMFSLHPEGMAFERNRPVRIQEGARYVVPVTFGLTMSF
jgi:hypothetical protein